MSGSSSVHQWGCIGYLHYPGAGLFESGCQNEFLWNSVCDQLVMAGKGWYNQQRFGKEIQGYDRPICKNLNKQSIAAASCHEIGEQAI